MSMDVYFATSNRNKFLEAYEILSKLGIILKWLRITKVEIQSDLLDEIARKSALEIAKRTGKHIVVEDDGLFIEALNGFPGPYSSFVYRTIGLKGVLKLLEGVEDRVAYFKSVVAYAEPNGFVKTFEGRIDGTISLEPRGEEGFGYDPIFIPESYNKTFAELGLKIKNTISHRRRAFENFAKWYIESRRTIQKSYLG